MKKLHIKTKSQLFFSIFLTLILFLFLIDRVVAQDVYTIKGRVTTIDHKPIGNVEIEVVKADNHFRSDVENIDSMGSFSFKVNGGGVYKIIFLAMGMDSTSINISLGENKLLIIPNVVLDYKIHNLNQVNITARKPLIELRNNKLIYNVPATASAGFSAFELLRKVPGVMIDGNNNILVKGQGGVKVMINNKLTELGSSEINAILQSKASDEIDNIEIITIPSSQFDAAGSGGIINFNLKKVKRDSFNGSTSSTFGYGKSPKYNNSLTLSYQSKKVSTYASISAINDDFERELIADRIITTNSNRNYFSDVSNGRAKLNMYSFLLGGDYSLSKFGTLGISLNSNIGRNHINNQTSTSIGQSAGQADSLLKSAFDTHQNKNNFNYDVFYTYKDDKDHLLSVFFDYASVDNSEKAFQPNSYFGADGQTHLRDQNIQTNNNTKIDIYAFKVDMELPLFKGKIAFGSKFSQVNTKNIFQYYNIKQSGGVLNRDQSNIFNYKENINAGYVSYNKNWKKIELQFGLRTEETISTGILLPTTGIGIITENKRSYFDFFPSASINLKIDSVNSLAFNYGRRIDRPNYQTLNPFELRSSELVYNKGNPNLSPQYTDKFTISYILGSNFSTSIGYSITNKFLNQFIDTLEQKKIIYMPINLGNSNTFYLDLNYSLQFSSSWRTNSYVSISHYRLKAELKNGKIDNSITSYYFNNSQEYNIDKSFTTSLTTYINGPFYYGTFRNKAIWGVDVGLQKKIFHDRGAIAFNAINIFNTMNYRNHLDYGGVMQNAVDKNENRIFKLSITYKFNSKNIASKKNKSAADEENNRTN